MQIFFAPFLEPKPLTRANGHAFTTSSTVCWMDIRTSTSPASGLTASTSVTSGWPLVRASLEVSRSLSQRGSPAAGHLLPTFPSLFISRWQSIPLPVKAPPLPSPHFLLSSAEFGTAPPMLSPMLATRAKARWADPVASPSSWVIRHPGSGASLMMEAGPQAQEDKSKVCELLWPAGGVSLSGPVEE